MTERVKELIAEQLGLQPDDIRPECSFVDDLGADSLDLVELLMAFSDEFDIEINDEEAENKRRIELKQTLSGMSRETDDTTGIDGSVISGFVSAQADLLKHKLTCITCCLIAFISWL